MKTEEVKDQFVLVLGDSRSLPRIPAQVDYQQTYPFLLRQWWESEHGGKRMTIWPLADGSLLIREVLARYKKFRFYFGETRLDTCLVMVGLVDCAPRPLSWGVRDRLSRWPEPLKRMIIGWLHRARPWLLSRGWFFRFTEPPQFQPAFRELLNLLSEGFDRVYVSNIAPAAQRNYDRSPGLKESIEEYNSLIAGETARFSNLRLVDVWEDFTGGKVPVDVYLDHDDGLHLSVKGHMRLKELIAREEEKQYERTSSSLG